MQPQTRADSSCQESSESYWTATASNTPMHGPPSGVERPGGETERTDRRRSQNPHSVRSPMAPIHSRDRLGRQINTPPCVEYHASKNLVRRRHARPKPHIRNMRVEERGRTTSPTTTGTGSAKEEQKSTRLPVQTRTEGVCENTCSKQNRYKI